MQRSLAPASQDRLGSSRQIAIFARWVLFTKRSGHGLFHETSSVVRISAENDDLVSGAETAMHMPQTWQRISQSRGRTSNRMRTLTHSGDWAHRSAIAHRETRSSTAHSEKGFTRCFEAAVSPGVSSCIVAARIMESATYAEPAFFSCGSWIARCTMRCSWAWPVRDDRLLDCDRLGPAWVLAS